MSEQEARDFSVALGAEITYWRKRRGLNREALAAKVDMSPTTLGRIERGSLDAAAATADVWRIAAVLGLSFSDLVRRTEESVDLSGVPDTSIPDVAEAALYGDEEAGAPEVDN